MASKLNHHADKAGLNYAQCWEDADVLMSALDIQPGQTCVSIASGGENTLAMLTRAPARVIAVDLNPAQIACLELKVAAFRVLTHAQLLALIGSTASDDRLLLYKRCTEVMTPSARRFWDQRLGQIACGIGHAGRFERYLQRVRTWVLPLVHSQHRVARLLNGGSPEQRADFYEHEWDNLRWRLMFRLCFSRLMLGRFARYHECFRYVESDVASHLLDRTRRGLSQQDPSANPYLQWMFTGRHNNALPYALRPEHFDTIRANLDRLEWRCGSLGDVVDSLGEATVDRFNLSNVFEYMPQDAYVANLRQLARCGRDGARLAYWNLLVKHHRPEALADHLNPLEKIAAALSERDQTFFYDGFVLEEVRQ